MSSADYFMERKKRAVRRRFEARELLNRMKAGPCVDCKSSFQPCQMDFFRRGGGKPVSRMLLRSKEAIVRQVESCDLVCANCGRLRTWRAQREARMGPT
jgi:hypothetical protein